MLDSMNEDYVRTARAKGLSERKVMTRHVLRNSLIPIVTLFGLDFGATIAGTAIITESSSSSKGSASTRRNRSPNSNCRRSWGSPSTAPSSSSRSTPLVDIAYAYLDPRVRLGTAASMSPAPLLEVRDLRVGFATEGGLVQAVDEVSFEVRPGEVLAIVGESGSGKSVTAQTIMGLTRSKNSRIEGSVKLDGEELVDASDAELRRLRGDRVSMVFQDPMTSFNPVYRLGRQIAEAMRAHGDVSKAEGARPGDRAVRGGRHPQRRAPGRRLPARILRRDATAGDDRDGAGAGTGAADRRRADDRARRDDPGPDPATCSRTSTANATWRRS